MNETSVLEGISAAESDIDDVYADCPPSLAELIAVLTEMRANPWYCRGYLVTLAAHDLLTMDEALMIIGEVSPTETKRTKIPKSFRTKKSKK